MFTFDDRSRRFVCRLGFVGLCVVPTLGVTAWAIAWRTASHVAALERRLSDALDLDVSIAAVAHPRPGTIVCTGVELSDAEHAEPLATAARIEATRSGSTLVVRTDELETARGAIASCWPALRRLLARRNLLGHGDVHLVAGDVRMNNSDGPMALREAAASLETKENVAQAELQFELVDQPGSEPVTLLAVRRHDRPAPPVTTLELHTGDASLPAALFDGVVDARDWLGPACRFAGSVWATETAGSWEVEAGGKLSEIDLDRAVTMRFPHKLSGRADLVLRRARLRNGRIEQATGELVAGPGVVSRSLLVSAAESLQLAWYVPRDAEGLVAYEQLAAAVSIDARGVLVEGICADSPAGSLLVDHSRVLLGQGTSLRPVTSLVRMLVPQGGVQVPATRETGWLIARLPLEGVVAPWNEGLPQALGQPTELSRPDRR